jgi:hypothetical protein
MIMDFDLNVLVGGAPAMLASVYSAPLLSISAADIAG